MTSSLDTAHPAAFNSGRRLHLLPRVPFAQKSCLAISCSVFYYTCHSKTSSHSVQIFHNTGSLRRKENLEKIPEEGKNNNLYYCYYYYYHTHTHTHTLVKLPTSLWNTPWNQNDVGVENKETILALWIVKSKDMKNISLVYEGTSRRNPKLKNVFVLE